MSTATVISLDEHRARRTGIPTQVRPPMLRIVRPDDPPVGQVFTLEVFLARARAVMSEPHTDLAS
ncbi:MAG TPA: hypothetical protein VE824_07705 [Gaiellales bacterium]|nr:hypothetical protein [Gaiellales bacterium]